MPWLLNRSRMTASRCAGSSRVPTSQAEEAGKEAPEPVIPWYRRVVSTVMVWVALDGEERQPREGCRARRVLVLRSVSTTETREGPGGLALAVLGVTAPIARTGSAAISAARGHLWDTSRSFRSDSL